MTEGLTVDRLSVDRGGRPVLRDLCFALPAGAAVVVTGSNGAGKSTLLRAIAGFIPLVGGSVRLGLRRLAMQATITSPDARSPSPLAGEGAPKGRMRGHATSGYNLRDPSSVSRLRRDPPSPARGEGERAPETVAGVELQENMSYLGHGNGLKLSLTAAENLRFVRNWAGGGGLSAHEALAAVDLPHVADFPVRILSAGQRRRVALAGLLVTRRPLWLLDEPATALDAASEAMLGGLLRAHLDDGGLVLAAIHSPLDLPARELHLGTA